MKQVTRRTFIQNSAFLTLLRSIYPRQILAATKDTGWEPKRPVNPQIDNMRVVCAVNPSIITKNPQSWQPEEQNTVINTSEVDRTLDSMAVSLSQKKRSPPGLGFYLSKTGAEAMAGP
ncbi:MAG TPA: hypothetical protein VHO70_23895 [Chitinispirillaceae bacterium]|nr:hypothetical protein [Chitinispirillaceae bacterium]